MSEDANPTPSRSQLREEAAEWFAIMRGPDADARREDFNKWLARGALHMAAYNSITETFNLGKILKDDYPRPRISDVERPGDDKPRPMRSRRWPKAGVVVASALGLSALGITSHILGWSPLPFTGSSTSAPPRAPIEMRFATNVGEIRSFSLSDGSRVALDTNSLVLASYTESERGFRLLNGRARFYVAHETRPFLVHANLTVVRARGTIFDVALLSHQRVAVHLVRGSIVVQSQPVSSGPPADSAPLAAAPETNMSAGEHIVIEGLGPISKPAPPTGNDNWPEGVQAFNDVPLSDVVSEANRYSQMPIVFEAPDIGALHVSGTFHMQDTRKVAERLAGLLKLALDESGGALILRRTCPPSSGGRCIAPS